jgi:glucosyl-dolichyl phosphate glucuronosyltransferase
MTIILSIVVCTYNRASILKKALADLSFPLQANSGAWEVIIIDNASTDTTRETTDYFVRQFSNFRYYCETKIGLSHARNRGWQEAKGEYVAYVDDDCRIPSDWIVKSLKIIEEKSPLAFGGIYLPDYEKLKPGWYKDTYGTYLRGRYPKQAGAAENFNLTGCNIVVQRKLLELLGGFEPKLGMAGSTIGYSEEDDLQMRIRQRWPDGLIYFDPELTVNHLIRPVKMRISWRIQHEYQWGRSRAILNNKPARRMSFIEFILRLSKIYLLICLSFIKGFVFRDRSKYPFFNNWFYEVTAIYFSHLGGLVQRWDDQLKADRVN